jgi:hypothetical protein
MDVHDKKLAERSDSIEPTDHDAYWSDKFSERPYVKPGSSFDDYGPAYRYGVEDGSSATKVISFDEAEAAMREEWQRTRGTSKLDWEDAKHPVPRCMGVGKEVRYRSRLIVARRAMAPVNRMPAPFAYDRAALELPGTKQP